MASLRQRAVKVAIMVVCLGVAARCGGDAGVAEVRDLEGAADVLADKSSEDGLNSDSGLDALGESDTPSDSAVGTDLQGGDEGTVLPGDATYIDLKGDHIEVDGQGVTVSGAKAVIFAPGTYVVDGLLADGQLSVDTLADGLVQIILDGVNMSSSTTSPLYIASADVVEVQAKEGTENTLSDAPSYVYPDAATDEPNAALFSKANLRVTGSGKLIIKGNYKDGIVGKDELTLNLGQLEVNAADDGIRGKDLLHIEAGTIVVKSGGDGLKSDNADELGVGIVEIVTGFITIDSEADAIQAASDLHIYDGVFDIKTAGGSSQAVADSATAKALKGTSLVVVDAGTFNLDCADDAIHSNVDVELNGGDFTIATSDDAIHGDTSVVINEGLYNISKCYEGIESTSLTINGGTIHLVSSDDGINAADGTGSGGGPGMPPGGGGNFWLYINDGYIYVDALGDGLDINGSVQMKGGSLIVNGPTGNMNGAVDYDGTFSITGGYVAAAGSSGMAMAPSTQGSTVYSVLVNFSSQQQPGTIVHIEDSDGLAVITFKPTKKFQSLALSSSALVKGETYKVYLGGSSTGDLIDSLHIGGTYTPGTLYTSFTISSMVTKLGSSGKPTR